MKAIRKVEPVVHTYMVLACDDPYFHEEPITMGIYDASDEQAAVEQFSDVFGCGSRHLAAVRAEHVAWFTLEDDDEPHPH